MRKTVTVVLAVFLTACAWSSANALTLNFENGMGNKFALSNNSNLIESSSDNSNLLGYENNARPMGSFSVSPATGNFADVIIQDGGDSWIGNQISSTASLAPLEPVPEPATLVLFGLGLIGGVIRKRMTK